VNSNVLLCTPTASESAQGLAGGYSLPHDLLREPNLGPEFPGSDAFQAPCAGQTSGERYIYMRAGVEDGAPDDYKDCNQAHAVAWHAEENTRSPALDGATPPEEVDRGVEHSIADTPPSLLDGVFELEEVDAAVQSGARDQPSLPGGAVETDRFTMHSKAERPPSPPACTFEPKVFDGATEHSGAKNQLSLTGCASDLMDVDRTMEDANMRIRPSLPSGAAMPEDEAVEDNAPDARLAFGNLSPQRRTLLLQIFNHYLGPGGVAVGKGLCLTQFRRFLRDCGLLGTDEAPALAPRFRGLGIERETAGSGTNAAHHTGVEPALTRAEGDFMLVRAAAATGEAQGQRLLTVEAFFKALQHIADHCFPVQGGLSRAEAFDCLCDRVLAPLRARFPAGRDVLDAVALLADAEMASLLSRSQPGLAKVFAKHATGVRAPEPYRRGHWTAQAFTRFASEADLVADLSRAALHRLFGESVAYEVESGRGAKERMSFSGFQLALVVISERVHARMRDTPLDRLALILVRLSHMPGGPRELRASARATKTHEA